MRPRLSILLPAMKGYESVHVALDAWERQACRDHLEIVVVFPGDSSPPGPHPEGQVLVPVGDADLHEARAIGIGMVRGDYVMLAEDHCRPAPNWAAAVLGRLDEGWDAVASALGPGDRTTCWAEASSLLGYSEWMEPVAGGPVRILCGWNGTMRTSLLKQFGSDLPDQFLVGAFLVRQLREQGHKFYLENQARMRHYDPPGGWFELYLMVIVGLGFGAMRTRQWPWLGRLLYPLAIPAIAFLHWKRGFTHYRRADSACGLRPTSVAAAAVLALAWAIGEAAGAWLGLERVAPHLWRTEVKPVGYAEFPLPQAIPAEATPAAR
jgi:hypothetical protein